MKRLYPIIVLLLIVIPCMAYDFSAPDVNSNIIYYNITGNGSVEVTFESTDYASYSGDVVIPETVSHGSTVYSVTSIGTSAFTECTGLTSVTIPNSLTSLSLGTFDDCDALALVTLNNNAIVSADYTGISSRNISYYFGNSVKKFIIGDAVTSIGNSAFESMYHITSIELSNNITSIGTSAFSECTGLTSIELPNGMTSISENTFFGCTGLKSVTIPNTVTSIDGSAFYRCTGLTTIELPNGITSIGESAFCDCTNLTSIEFPNGITSIGNYAFMYCSSLTSVTIPSSVTSLGSGAFDYCTALATVTLNSNAIASTPNAVYTGNTSYNNISDYFGNSVKKFIIGDAVTTIGKYAFEGMEYIISIELSNNITSIGEYAFANCKGLTIINIPTGVTVINDYTFNNCQNLSTIILPKGITAIGDEAFSQCAKLDSVYCAATTPPYIAADLTPFSGISSNAVLFVPYESVPTYQANSIYASAFREIRSFSDPINVTETTADIIWLPDPDVTQYTVNVYRVENLVAQYIVDGEGQVISSHRFAPSVYKQKLDTTTSSTEYFVVSIDKLEAGAEYIYTIEGTNSSEQQIYHEEGTFQTNSMSGIFDPITNEPQSTRKIIRNGKIYILRGDQIYDLQGRLLD